MYPQRFSQSIVSSHPNLTFKRLVLENNHYHYFLKYSLMIRQKFSGLSSFKEVHKELQDFFKNGEFYKMMIQCTKSKSQSNNVLKIWAHHCECVLAQRLRRCQQMVCLYSKWWEERALKEFVKKMRLNLLTKGKDFAFGAIGISAYNWKKNRIPDEYIVKHINELEYIYVLKENTICLACTSPTLKDSNSTVCKCGTKSSAKSYDDWTPFINKNDLIVWRRLHPSGQYEYKVYGSYNDVSAEDFLNVQIDTNYRRTWDATAVMLEVAETDPTPDSNSDIIYWEMLWPRLFVNRDYVFNRRYLVDGSNKTVYIVSKSTEHPAFPKYPEKYRIEDYWSCMVIKPYTDMTEPGIEFSLTYFDNPGVNIPSSVTTWVSMKAMPDFLERLRDASKKYRQYCQREGISKACQILNEEERKKEELRLKDQLDYCRFQPKKSAKLKASQPKPDVEDKKSKPPERFGLNSGNISRNINNSPSENNSTPPSAAVQSESSNFWKYLHPMYYF